ncbi:MFS transporter [Paenibacillus doosanensis]|uniref:MFS transporter n=1 Tax=Paenibacillus doosanensis TaxID=1229154 RepID=UPI0021809287|nr:MFS transporter [Paenibacillus doosanensis]MCS7460171.1 MFS transporter [Paenibacillus doosanensis]
MESASQPRQPRFAVQRGFTFSFYMTTAVIVSFFPLYFQSIGYSTVQIGLLYSIGPMIGIVSNLFWGVVSDKLSTVRKILIGILAGQFLLALLLFHTSHFGLLMLLMALFFFFQSPTSSLNDSLTLLSISGTNKSYASFRVWGSTGFAFASLAFGLLLKQQGSGLTVFLCLGSIGLSFLLSFFLTDAGSGARKKPELRGMIQVIGSRPFLLFLLTVIVVSIAHRFNDGFLALFLQRIGADSSLVGWSWMVSAVSEIPTFFLLSKYGHRYKELPLLAVCGVVYFIRFALMSRVDNPLWVIAIQAMHSISFGIFFFTAVRYIQNVVPDEYRSTGQAVFAVCWSGIAGLISGTLGGWLFRDFGPHMMYGVGACLSLLAVAGFLLLHYCQRKA